MKGIQIVLNNKCEYIIEKIIQNKSIPCNQGNDNEQKNKNTQLFNLPMAKRKPT